MRLKNVFLPAIITTLALGGQWPSAPGHVHAAQSASQTSELPPISYVCPMDADVLETEPGNCPICKMKLEAVRIDTAFSCPNHAAVIRDKTGVCPLDKRELVQVIVAKHWTCADKPNEKLPDPGKCSDGSTRKLVSALRAHGDHNPRHGGSFFMAEDKWHHLEGTYPSAGLFRMFFYDNFTKPLNPKKFTGRVIFEEAGKETASFPMSISKNGQTMEAQLKGVPAQPSKTTPVRLAAKIKFDPNTPEQRFDFVFVEYSKEPPASGPNATPATTGSAAPRPTSKPRAATSTGAAARPAPAAPAAVTPAAAAAAAAATAAPAPPPAASAAVPSPAPVPSSASNATAVTGATTAGVSQTSSSTTLSRTDASQLVDNLPSSPAELLALLQQRTDEVHQAINEGQLGYVYIPALLSKDIALAMGDRVNQLPEQRQAQANEAVRRLVLAAWDLDFYGDLGNREKLTDVYNTFAAAFADIKTAYGAPR